MGFTYRRTKGMEGRERFVLVKDGEGEKEENKEEEKEGEVAEK